MGVGEVLLKSALFHKGNKETKGYFPFILVSFPRPIFPNNSTQDSLRITT